MKPASRIATAAAALALFIAPAAALADQAPSHPMHDCNTSCRCAAPQQGQPKAEKSQAPKAEKKVAQPSAPEAPVFTDQG